MAEDSNSLLKKIAEDIEKTGFPVEITASDILSKDGREITPNAYYLDLDENKGREIDIIATLPIFNDHPFIYLEHSLICSVKKSIKPWVIFTTEDTGIDQPGWSRLHLSEGITSDTLESWTLDKNSTLRHFQRFGRSYYIAFRGDGYDIFDALCSSVKAAEAHRSWVQKINDEEKKRLKRLGVKKKNDISLSLFEPVVILDGKIFEAYLDVKKQLLITEVDHIPISFGYLSKYYTHSEDYMNYPVELITINKLPEF